MLIKDAAALVAAMFHFLHETLGGFREEANRDLTGDSQRPLTRERHARQTLALALALPVLYFVEAPWAVGVIVGFLGMDFVYTHLDRGMPGAWSAGLAFLFACYRAIDPGATWLPAAAPVADVVGTIGKLTVSLYGIDSIFTWGFWLGLAAGAIALRLHWVRLAWMAKRSAPSQPLRCRRPLP